MSVSTLCSIRRCMRTSMKQAAGCSDRRMREIGFAQQQRASVRGDRSAVERRRDRASSEAGEIEAILATLCRHRGALLRRGKALSQKQLSRKLSPPMRLFPVRYAG